MPNIYRQTHSNTYLLNYFHDNKRLIGFKLLILRIMQDYGCMHQLDNNISEKWFHLINIWIRTFGQQYYPSLRIASNSIDLLFHLFLRCLPLDLCLTDA